MAALSPLRGRMTSWPYTYWLHFAEGSAMPPATMKLVFDMLPQRTPFIIRPIAAMLGKAVDAQYLAPDHRAAAGVHRGQSRQGAVVRRSRLHRR